MLFHPQHSELKNYWELFPSACIPCPCATTTIASHLSNFLCLCEADIWWHVRHCRVSEVWMTGGEAQRRNLLGCSGTPWQRSASSFWDTLMVPSPLFSNSARLRWTLDGLSLAPDSPVSASQYMTMIIMTLFYCIQSAYCVKIKFVLKKQLVLTKANSLHVKSRIQRCVICSGFCHLNEWKHSVSQLQNVIVVMLIRLRL